MGTIDLNFKPRHIRPLKANVSPTSWGPVVSKDAGRKNDEAPTVRESHGMDLFPMTDPWEEPWVVYVHPTFGWWKFLWVN